MSYQKCLQRDLDAWIAQGWVAAERRDEILGSVAEPKRVDGATALAFIGAVMLGLALVAFIGANWDGMSRLLRFVIVLALFAGASGAAAWAAWKSKPITMNALTTVAALVFAAAVGLIGQIFDIAGRPEHALIGSGVGAALLALAARSSGAGVAALLLLGFGDAELGNDGGMPILLGGSLLAGLAAWSWRATGLAHAAGLALNIALIATCFEHNMMGWFLLAAAVCAGGAYLARQGREEHQVATVFYGWLVWTGSALLVCAGLLGFRTGPDMIPHRLAWLVASGAVVAPGRHDRHALVTAGGIVYLIAGVFALLVDLGVDLTTAALLFLGCAAAALIAGFALRKSGART
jgi:uncharacterized membrane protein